MPDATPVIDTLSETQRQVLVALQSDFPLTERPYADLGQRFQLSERQVYGFAEDLRNGASFAASGQSSCPTRWAMCQPWPQPACRARRMSTAWRPSSTGSPK